MSWKVDKH